VAVPVIVTEPGLLLLAAGNVTTPWPGFVVSAEPVVVKFTGPAGVASTAPDPSTAVAVTWKLPEIGAMKLYDQVLDVVPVSRSAFTVVAVADHAEPVHHWIGVGERAEQQHRDRIENQERQQDQQRARP
jgi:hypothetical protein